MRVIAGSKRRLPLKTVSGKGTRPTQDRIKETLFNMIQNELVDKVFLDIFAGSGQIGIEALSRGCSYCYFIEQNKEAVTCIKENLSNTQLIDQSTVLSVDYKSALAQFSGNKLVDLVFMDPPYNQLYEKQVLELLTQYEILAPKALIIVEASLETDFSYVETMGYTLLKEKVYKTNKHIFLERK